MSSRVRKQNEPMKAFVPVSSLLVRGSGSLHCAASGGATAIGSKSLSATLSPPLRHISPEHVVGLSGNRSPGALTYKGKKEVGGRWFLFTTCRPVLRALITVPRRSRRRKGGRGWIFVVLQKENRFRKVDGNYEWGSARPARLRAGLSGNNLSLSGLGSLWNVS